MTEIDLRKIQSLRKRLTKVSFGIVLGFGGLATLTIMQKPPQQHVQILESSGDRAPASVAGDIQLSLNKGFEVIDVKCNDDHSLSAKADQVRIRGTGCLGKENVALQSSTVVNQSNGFVATVFFQKQSRFTTDYIKLAKGKNKLIIENQFSNGKSEKRELEIVY